jgi:hypothetical protein
MPALWHAKMTEIINLNRARKAKARTKKGKTAQANRVAHGTPKALRNLAEARKDKAEKGLSGHVLEKERSVGESRSDQKEVDN